MSVHVTKSEGSFSIHRTGDFYETERPIRMYKKFDDETIKTILENGIDEFVEKGLKGAGMNEIARRSGVSVGVIYKYFKDKDNFFLECLNHSLQLLDNVLQEAAEKASDIREYIRNIVYALIKNSRLHSNYNAMYHEIMSGSCKKYAVDIVEKIEKKSADIYRNAMKAAQESNLIRSDTDPGILAFFFDNMLMMMQFSYSCEYYKERMKIFCPEAAEDDEKMAESLISFIESALQVQAGGAAVIRNGCTQ